MDNISIYVEGAVLKEEVSCLHDPISLPVDKCFKSSNWTWNQLRVKQASDQNRPTTRFTNKFTKKYINIKIELKIK